MIKTFAYLILISVAAWIPSVKLLAQEQSKESVKTTRILKVVSETPKAEIRYSMIMCFLIIFACIEKYITPNACLIVTNNFFWSPLQQDDGSRIPTTPPLQIRKGIYKITLWL